MQGLTTEDEEKKKKSWIVKKMTRTRHVVGTSIHSHEARKQKGNYSLTPDLLRIFKKGKFWWSKCFKKAQTVKGKNPACLIEVENLFNSNVGIPPTAVG